MVWTRRKWAANLYDASRPQHPSKRTVATDWTGEYPNSAKWKIKSYRNTLDNLDVLL